jgi:hypothetical protein
MKNVIPLDLNGDFFISTMNSFIVAFKRMDRTMAEKCCCKITLPKSNENCLKDCF